MTVALSGPVGFDAFPNQVNQKVLRKGFSFNLMVVGQTGLGKSTFVNSLFSASLLKSKGTTASSEVPNKTTKIETSSVVLEENNVKMYLNLIDTPGFADNINNDKSWEPIVEYINSQYARYLSDEQASKRKTKLDDSRVHCVLYFITPSGHSLKALDIEAMKHISKIANLVPIIAKSDALTKSELKEFKERIKHDLSAHKIECFPSNQVDCDENDLAENAKIMGNLPFAVIGSDTIIEVNGQEVRGRKMRWGEINIEDPSHCDFVMLKDFMMKTHLMALIDTTNDLHYESFRFDFLSTASK